MFEHGGFVTIAGLGLSRDFSERIKCLGVHVDQELTVNLEQSLLVQEAYLLESFSIRAFLTATERI